MKKDDSAEMTLPEALNALRSGGKFWRAWAQVEEAAGVVEAALQNQSIVDSRSKEAADKLLELEEQVGEAEAALAARKAEAVEAVNAAKMQAAEIRAAADAEGQKIVAGARKDLAAAHAELAEVRGRIEDSKAELAALSGTLADAKGLIERGRAVSAALA